MSAWEQSNEIRSRRNGPRTAPDGTGNATGETGGAVGGALAVLPAPLAEKTLAAVHAVRDTGGVVWTAVRTRKTLASGTAAAVGAAALTGAYALGRRTGTRSRGPITRLTGGRI
ncbi:hypothetical protein [Streptomyces sp. NPDC012950]|uniref:hypothetical protein n=1 Tax=Streptomyces sp. NPDC012950 TaxID=3364858 RepID=UPI00368041BD